MKEKDDKSDLVAPALRENDTWDDIDSLTNEDIEDLEELEDAPVAVVNEGGYLSPLMAKLGNNRLTLEMLYENVPLIHAGEEARTTIAEGVRKGSKKLKELNQIVLNADAAKEKLFIAALPLIKSVAQREYRRRQQWGSQIALEDLTQEAILGFFKGIASFKPEAVKNSPTNYLGQWMLVGMRRSAEVMDHDLQVGHDAGERFRKVRAIRSRLMAELGREVTDQEISDASRNPAYLTRPGMIGKRPATGENHSIGKGLSVFNIEDERKARSRLGLASRFGNADSDDSEESSYVVDSDRLAPGDTSNLGLAADPADLAIEAASAAEVAKVVELVISRMRLPEAQREIIARRFGLHPYDGESSAREISRLMGVHREKVTKVLSAFSTEMTRKGGVFHAVISSIPEDEISAIGLSWIVTTLGEWDPSLALDTHVPTVLTEKMAIVASPEERAVGSTKYVGVLAWFQCDYHDRVFSMLYIDLRSVPKSRACAFCQKPSALIRTEYMGEVKEKQKEQNPPNSKKPKSR